MTTDATLFAPIMGRLLAILVILLAAWRPLCVALNWRFAFAFPDVAVKLRAGFMLFALFTAMAFLLMPNLLMVEALGTSAFFALERWRARPGFGRRRGLPPGSLGLFPYTWENDRFFLDEASKHGPIFKTSHILRPAVCIVDLEAGTELLRDHEQSLMNPQMSFSTYCPGGMLRYMSGPDRQHYRPILRRALSPQLAQQLMPDFARIARQGLAIIRAESAENAGGIKPSGHLDRMLGNFWLRLFFAIEAESEQGALLQSLLPFIEFNNPTRASRVQIRSAVKALCALVERQVDSWQGAPPPCLLGAVLADNAADAKDPVVIGNLIYMLHTTSSDMSGLLCWLLKMMSDHPHWLERLAGERLEKGRLAPGQLVREFGQEDAAGTSLLATRIVMETLRMRQSEYISRAAISDIRFRGFVIPRGWLIRIGVWECHQDPLVFENPEQFNPDRFFDRAYTRSEYMPFGVGSHACLAPHLATLVGSTFLNELASGYHLLAHAGGTLEFAPTRHWTPGAGYRVRLTRRQVTKLDTSK